MNDYLLPESNSLEISCFSEIFTNMSESYKLFWFRSIFDVIKSGKNTVTYNELINHMVIDAWNIVLKYGLNLGPSDNLEKLIKHLNKTTILDVNDKAEAIESILYILDDSEYKRIKGELIKNVPYRLQAPFIPYIKGKEWNVSPKNLIEKIIIHK